jgi:hypothetical protein
MLTPESLKRRIAPALSPSLFQLSFIGIHGRSRSAVFFELPDLPRAHETDIPLGSPCGKRPSDVLHFGFRGQSLVLVERAFTDREADLALNAVSRVQQVSVPRYADRLTIPSPGLNLFGT